MVRLLHHRLLICLSRLLVGATVLLPNTALAHIDFSAGKTPEQLFDSDCSGCHRSAEGLARGRPVDVLTEFLREHYTTKVQLATLLASYLIRGHVVSSENVGVTHRTVATVREQRMGNLPSERKTRNGNPGEDQQLRKNVAIGDAPSRKAAPEAESRKPRRVDNSIRAMENSFLKIIWAICRELSSTSWWLIGQLAKLLPA